MSQPSHTELFTFIRQKYSREALVACRKYINTAKRISRQHQHLAFNHRCKRYQLTPLYLRVKPLVPTPEGVRVARHCSLLFVSAQIGRNHQKIHRLGQQLPVQSRSLSHLMAPEDFSALESLRVLAQYRETEKCKSRQKRKFERLLNRSRGKRAGGSSERWVVNLSNKQLQPDELSVLEKGLNFAPTPNRVPYKEMVAAVENGLRRLPDDVADAARLRVVGILSQARASTSNLSIGERRAIKQLRDDESILILPADK